MSTENEVEVTFVGGRAVDQTENLESALPADEREAAMKAVREAMSGKKDSDKGRSEKVSKAKETAEEIGREVAEDADDIADKVSDPGGVNKFRKSEKAKEESQEAPERGPDGKFLPKTDSKASSSPKDDVSDEELDLDKASVKQLLKAREKVANLKRTAAEMSKEQAKFADESRQVQDAWRQIQAREAQLKANESRWQKLQQNPSEAVRALGLDPEAFIMNLARDGTPEGAMERRFRELEAKLTEANSWKEQQAEQQRQYQAHLQEQQVAHARTTAVQEFTKLGMDEDKFPHVSAFYKGRERALVAEGDLTAEEFRNLTGREGSYEQILEYIEDELADRAKAWYSKVGAKKEAASASRVIPPKAKGKSISPDMSGERRSASPKDLKDLSPEDRLEVARQAVAAAMAGAKR
jgi:hypothetical protein